MQSEDAWKKWSGDPKMVWESITGRVMGFRVQLEMMQIPKDIVHRGLPDKLLLLLLMLPKGYPGQTRAQSYGNGTLPGCLECASFKLFFVYQSKANAQEQCITQLKNKVGLKKSSPHPHFSCVFLKSRFCHPLQSCLEIMQASLSKEHYVTNRSKDILA